MFWYCTSVLENEHVSMLCGNKLKKVFTLIRQLCSGASHQIYFVPPQTFYPQAWIIPEIIILHSIYASSKIEKLAS